MCLFEVAFGPPSHQWTLVAYILTSPALRLKYRGRRTRRQARLLDLPEYMPQDRNRGYWVMPALACAWVRGPACSVKYSPDVSNI